MIHEEWISNLLKNRQDITRKNLENTKALMNRAVPDSLVTDFEDLISSLELPDKNDRHVLAAALRARADVIVTMNLKDFPNNALKQKYKIEVQHPDEFIADLLDINLSLVCITVHDIRSRLKKRTQTAQELLNNYERIGLTETATILREFERLL